MKNAVLNTNLLLIYLLTLLLYWTKLFPDLNNNQALVYVSSFVLVVMTVSYYTQAFGKKAFDNEDRVLLAVFTVLIIGHTVFSQTTMIQALNIYFTFCLYLVLSKVAFNEKIIYSAIFLTFVLLSFLDLPAVIAGILNPSNQYSGFSGVFTSANSIGDWGCTALLCLLLIYEGVNKNRKMKIFIGLIFLFIVIFASHMRSALLLLAVWWLTNRLLKRQWKRGVIYVGFITMLTVLGYYMVISEVFSVNASRTELELFGKDASSRGRSEQIYFALQKFDITPFGEGRGIVNASVADEVRYAVHNTFVGFLLEYGLLIFIFYFFFWFRLFKRGPNITASFILAYHVLLFFEPENFFSNQLLSFMAFSVTIITEGTYKRKQTEMQNIIDSKDINHNFFQEKVKI